MTLVEPPDFTESNIDLYCAPICTPSIISLIILSEASREKGQELLSLFKIKLVNKVGARAIAQW